MNCITDLERLVARKKIVPAPDESPIYKARRGRHDAAAGEAAPSDAMAALKEWIAAGARRSSPARARVYYARASQRVDLADLEKIDRRRRQRYSHSRIFSTPARLTTSAAPIATPLEAHQFALLASEDSQPGAD